VANDVRRVTAVLVAVATAAPGAAAARVAQPDPGRAARPIEPAAAAGITNPEAIEPAIAAAINSLRRRHGLRPLPIAARLARAGDAHARALAVAGLFTHDWPDGRPFIRWIPDYYPHVGFRWWRVGENLLWSAGELTPQLALNLWLTSPPHRRVLLSPSWRQIGIGVVHAEHATGAYGGLDVYVVAAEFGARR
jgi:uncharacterized protein YkwD